MVTGAVLGTLERNHTTYYVGMITCKHNGFTYFTYFKFSIFLHFLLGCEGLGTANEAAERLQTIVEAVQYFYVWNCNMNDSNVKTNIYEREKYQLIQRY